MAQSTRSKEQNPQVFLNNNISGVRSDNSKFPTTSLTSTKWILHKEMLSESKIFLRHRPEWFDYSYNYVVRRTSLHIRVRRHQNRLREHENTQLNQKNPRLRRNHSRYRTDLGYYIPLSNRNTLNPRNQNSSISEKQQATRIENLKQLMRIKGSKQEKSRGENETEKRNKTSLGQQCPKSELW